MTGAARADIMTQSGGGVSQPRTTTVDVQDMLCAQALAVVAQALARVAVGEWIDVAWNGDDVRRDLVAWAADRGHRYAEVPNARTLRIRRDR